MGGGVDFEGFEDVELDLVSSVRCLKEPAGPVKVPIWIPLERLSVRRVLPKL